MILYNIKQYSEECVSALTQIPTPLNRVRPTTFVELNH